MTAENTIESSAPAPSAEVVQPSQEAPAETGAAEGTGASEPTAEQREQERQRASEAARVLNERKKQNAAAAFARIQQQNAENTRRLAEAVEALRAQQQPQKPTDDAPKRDQFDSYEDWVRADARYHAAKQSEEIIARQFHQLAQQAQAAQAQQQVHEIASRHSQRVAEFAKANPEFAEAAMNTDFEVPPMAVRAIVEMEEGPALMLAMHKDPGIVRELAKRSELGQAIYLGELVASLRSKPPQTSKAPPPGKTVGASSAGDGSPSDNDSDAEWIRKRNAQIRKG